MKERPILFSGPMVRAILGGRKTQTRRLDGLHNVNLNPDGYRWTGERFESVDGLVTMWLGECPKGKPGDRLWVRESFQPLFADGVRYEDTDWQTGRGCAPRYVATDGRTEWMDKDDKLTDRCKPSIHMPRWASRITLEITNVRVQRVQEISEKDAIAEGVTSYGGKFEGCYGVSGTSAMSGTTAGECFGRLWDSINAKRGYGWDANPWVWAITFKRLSE